MSKESEVHDALQSHDWMILRPDDRLMTFQRRICKLCDRVEWFATDTEEWHEEEDPHFIMIMKRFREYPEAYNTIRRHDKRTRS